MGKAGNKNGIKHGMARTNIYRIWSRMIERCHNEKNKNYFNYGGRGITVCEEWRQSFINFYKDMGDRPPSMSLDRIDNNKGYSRENCRWATPEQQMANTRAANLIEYNGETLPIAQWARKLGVSRNRIRTRLKIGMSVEQALTMPKLDSWHNREPVLKTHCKWGHEFTQENTTIKKSGRRCKICRREDGAKRNRMKTEARRLKKANKCHAIVAKPIKTTDLEG